MKLKREKCAFCLSQVEYPGYIISAEGLYSVASKVKTIKEAPKPSSLPELNHSLALSIIMQSIFWTQQHFMTYSTSYTEPWNWDKEQQVAFEKFKEILTAVTAPILLVHFDENKPIMLSCDASPYGVGAVLFHLMDNHSDKPIAYASHSLSTLKQKYSQLDKEALAILFGVSKFHHSLYGRHFVIYSDHKPLMHTVNHSKAVPAMASSRLQRWALTLSSYHYSIKYHEGSHMCNADVLSRLPLPDCPTNVPMLPETTALLEQLALQPHKQLLVFHLLNCCLVIIYGVI